VGELVALGVTAEVITIVEHENPRVGPGGTAIIPCRRKPADAAANHNQIVALVDRRVVGVEVHLAARKRMRGLERAIMLAAEPG
jgi:hypothetical protein